MDHESFRNDLPAYLTSRLEGEGLAKLEEHMQSCESCAEIAAAGREIVAALKEAGEGMFEAHPSELRLREFALAGGGAEGVWVGAHLTRCASCALEVDAWKSREFDLTARSSAGREGRPELGQGGVAAAPTGMSHDRVLGASVWPPEARRAAPLLIGLAAGLVLGIALTAAWRSLPGFRPDQSASEVRIEGPARPVPEPWSGPLRMSFLEGTLRGGALQNRVEVSAEDPYVLLQVRLDLPGPGAPGERLSFEIRDERGRVTWSKDLTAEELAFRMDSRSSVLPLLLPARALSAGRYELRVLAAAAETEPPRVQIPFEVSAPQAARQQGAGASPGRP